MLQILLKVSVAIMKESHLLSNQGDYMKKEERLSTLEDMIYNYTELSNEGDVCSERQLEEIFKFCVENSRCSKKCSPKRTTKRKLQL